MNHLRYLRSSLPFLLASAFLLSACSSFKTGEHALSDADVAAIRAVSDAYVRGWLEDDTLAILNTLDVEPVLMPAGMRPIVGVEQIKQFWWPDDGSRTVVTDYTMEVEEIAGNNKLAYTRGSAELTFTYEKDGERTKQTNLTMYLTVYRQQLDGEWRILRRMWGPLHR